MSFVVTLLLPDELSEDNNDERRIQRDPQQTLHHRQPRRPANRPHAPIPHRRKLYHTEIEGVEDGRFADENATPSFIRGAVSLMCVLISGSPSLVSRVARK